MLPARFSGVRTKILAIALIPSLVLLVFGAALSIYLIQQGRHAKQYAQAQSNSVSVLRELEYADEQERQLSLWQLGGGAPDPRALAAVRTRFDTALKDALGAEAALRHSDTRQLGGIVNAFDQLKTQLPLLRAGIDTGAVAPADAYAFYTRLLDGMDQGTALVQQTSPNATIAVELTQNLALLRAVEEMSRTRALTAAVLNQTGLTPALSIEYRNLVGSYHTDLDRLADELGSEFGGRIKELAATPAWQQVTAMEDALLRPALARPPGGPPPPGLNAYGPAAGQVNEQLMTLWSDYDTHTEADMAAVGDRELHNALLAGGANMLAVLVAFLLSLWLADRIIQRLRRLRNETLALAEVGLPETMRRLAAGESVDTETESARLDFGTDEIGSVAQAFNRAHSAAVGAAITEARTREGVRAVFLNIAHRSQIVVHRLLEVLDEAERRQEDPALLDVFFRLDHLATRERRNAENLTILGGGRPGRKWRRPVPLTELVRSAVAESRDYARVHIGRFPQIYIMSTAVADLVHLLAELVDNATHFSPAQSRVEVSGTVIGKGVAIEISDQGMGMSPDELTAANRMLSGPPDFGIATLQADSRLGLFVVARLGAQHAISVRLSDSDYGGIRAIVVVPTALSTTDPAAVENLPTYLTGHRADPPAPAEMAARSDSPAPQYGPVGTLAPPAPARGATAAPAWDRPPSPKQRPAAPALPKRRRQASLAPELARSPAEPPPEPPAPRHQRSAEQARDLMSTIENGTRQGRRDTPEPSAYRPAHLSDDQKGNDDRFPRR